MVSSDDEGDGEEYVHPWLGFKDHRRNVGGFYSVGGHTHLKLRPFAD